MSLGSATHLPARESAARLGATPTSVSRYHVAGAAEDGEPCPWNSAFSGDTLSTHLSNKEFQMASSGPGESSAHRRKPAVWVFVLLSAVIAIVLLVVLL